jgi:uncharacterized protein YdhG (YjbR/CyaY superfamily)
METNHITTIDSYISLFSGHKRDMLEQLRATIKKAAPEAQEVISYQMPAFRMYGILVYFAAHKNHIGFYPTGSAIEAFGDETSVYKGGRGTLRFSVEEQLPLDLVFRMVQYRIVENKSKSERKAKKKD